MIKTIYFQDFRDAFKAFERDNFTHNGQRALFDHLERLEEDTGEQMELDVIALCCEYTEYANVIEAYNEYMDITTLDQDNGDLGASKALEWLQERTQVIEFKGGVIIQNF